MAERSYMLSLLLQKINQIDVWLYYLLSQDIKNPFLDKWMPIITNMDNWIWILALGWAALFIFGGRRGRMTCIVVIIAVLFSDNLTSYILKPLFGRVRPNIALGLTDIVGSGLSSPSPSFPSNHAVNVFTIAMALSWYYKELSPVWFAGAGVVGFSRVYVGVHYPFDVVGGAVVGVVCSLCIIWLGNRIDKFIRRKYVRYRNV